MSHFFCGLLLSIKEDKRTGQAHKISRYTTTRKVNMAVFFLKSNRLTTNISYSDFAVESLKLSFWFDGRNRCKSEAFSKTTSGTKRTAVSYCHRKQNCFVFMPWKWRPLFHLCKPIKFQSTQWCWFCPIVSRRPMSLEGNSKSRKF